jgi:superfamily I DNA/RNA helicase
LQFKQTLAFMDLDFPFSKAFGLADSREHCLQSAEAIFRCFVPASFQDPDTLQFEAISSIAENPETGELDEKMLKDLVKIFRPERDGTLKLIDFVRSIDRVYKDFRLLRASIRNSSHIDQAFEAYVL